jgi:monofunctional biosynthetic peptidoglycan transglycosylase
MIAASLPNPKKYTVKPPSRYINQRYPWVLKQMNNLQGDPEIKQIVD